MQLFGHYVFWLATVSAGCLVAERLVPWRRGQSLLRPQLAQDAVWLIFNGWLASFAFTGFLGAVYRAIDRLFGFVFAAPPSTIAILAGTPLWLQVPVLLVVADLLEWCVHNALHATDVLWRFHRVHHSIEIMDWIGNFRFHWLEILLYQTVKYLPLALLGGRWEAILTVAVLSTTVGHLNHSNLNISWGVGRYVLNSPRMHIWHHDHALHGRHGVNFAVVFSSWDWMFGTAYMPQDPVQPARLGFQGIERAPRSLLMRFFLPWVDHRGRAATTEGAKS